MVHSAQPGSYARVVRDPGMDECIAACMECRRACIETAARCLTLGGKHAFREHQVLLLDCADICGLAADFMSRGSPSHAQACGVCAQICAACAAHCEQMIDGDQMMRACADMCRRCGDRCTRMQQGTRAVTDTQTTDHPGSGVAHRAGRPGERPEAHEALD